MQVNHEGIHGVLASWKFVREAAVVANAKCGARGYVGVAKVERAPGLTVKVYADALSLPGGNDTAVM